MTVYTVTRYSEKSTTSILKSVTVSYALFKCAGDNHYWFDTVDRIWCPTCDPLEFWTSEDGSIVIHTGPTLGDAAAFILEEANKAGELHVIDEWLALI